MSVAFRTFTLAYAAGLIAVALSNINRDFWPWIGFSAASYLALALGYQRSGDRDRLPSRIWLAVLFLLAVSLEVSMMFTVDIVGRPRLVFSVVYLLVLLAYLGWIERMPRAVRETRCAGAPATADESLCLRRLEACQGQHRLLHHLRPPAL